MSDLNSDVPIFQKTYALFLNFYKYLDNFPRKDRYSLGEKCKIAILEILESIVVTSKLSKTEKLPILKKASIKVDFLKILFRICRDTKCLDTKKYLALEADLQEIGRMLGGWIKSSSL